jgi:hypothetical protein
MQLSEGYVSLELARHADHQMLIGLERRRVIAERLAEAAPPLPARAHVAVQEAEDAGRPRRGIRALLARRLHPLTPRRATA